MIAKLIQLLKNFFGIPYKEARGLAVLFVFLFIAVFIPVLLKRYHLSQPRDPIESISLQKRSKQLDSITDKSPILFAFDPNSASYDSLILLGLNERVAARLISYRKNGGSFRKRSDLLRIYDLPEEWFNKVVDSIQLPLTTPETFVSSRSPVTPHRSDSISELSNSTTAERVLVDLNEADTISLKMVYGIGSVLSSRIARFRDQLGGFIGWQQLSEVYGLSEEVVLEMQKYFFIHDDFETRKLYINKASFKEVLSHPYLDYNQTKAIINYRDQHGNFTELADLEAIHLLSDTVVVKLEPYLSYE